MAITSAWPGAWAPVGRGARGGFGLPAVGQRARRTGPVRPAPRVVRVRRIAWRPLLSAAADVLMVLLWAAMIPGFMWLGSAAGF